MSVDGDKEVVLTLDDVVKWCEDKDHEKLASFFTIATGSVDGAALLLQEVINLLPEPNKVSRKRPAPANETPASTSSTSELPFLVHDGVDGNIVTALLLIPNEHSVIGAIIGPHGKSIKQITDRTGCTVTIDQRSDSLRNRSSTIAVFLQGSLRSVMMAAELLSTKVASIASEGAGAPWTQSGCGVNRTIMLIPDESVKRVIGKGGIIVSKVQQDSGAAVQMQQEGKMMSSNEPFFGREAVITGPLEARMHAMYLMCRIYLGDRDCPPTWRTLYLYPTPMRSGSLPSGPMTHNAGVHSLPGQMDLSPYGPPGDQSPYGPPRGQSPYGPPLTSQLPVGGVRPMSGYPNHQHEHHQHSASNKNMENPHSFHSHLISPPQPMNYPPFMQHQKPLMPRHPQSSRAPLQNKHSQRPHK